MVRRIIIRKNQYYDSVFLMQVARRMAAEPGIQDASAVLGTDANKKLLAEAGYSGTSPAEVAASRAERPCDRPGGGGGGRGRRCGVSRRVAEPPRG